MLPEIGLCTHARHPSASATALTLALMTAGGKLLGPSASVEGEWSAQGPGHSSYFGLSLRQTGDDPNFRVVVTQEAANPCCPWFVGQGFSGKIEDRGEIVVPASGLHFRRATAAACQ